MLDFDKKDYSKFVYEKGDIEFKSSQCDFCRYNNLDNKYVCIKFPNGKPEEIESNKKICKFIFKFINYVIK